jgi:signal transduction histidine kinase
LIEAQHGTIAVESALGHGTTTTLSLPSAFAAPVSERALSVSV